MSTFGDTMSPVGRRADTDRRSRVFVHDSVIENSQRLDADVVVHDHLLAADDDNCAQLARRQPAQFDVREGCRKGKSIVTNATSVMPLTTQVPANTRMVVGISSNQYRRIEKS